MSFTVRHLPEEDRPREKLALKGEGWLTSTELLAIIIGSGTKEKSVLELSQEVIAHFGSLQNIADASIEEICMIKGMGRAKAVQLKAAITLGRRSVPDRLSKKKAFSSPDTVYEYIRGHLEDLKQEHFMVVLLDTKGRLIRTQVVTIGSLNYTSVHPREVFHPAIRHNAAGIIIAHNHPSGDPTPSLEDIDFTKVMLHASQAMAIPLKDHLIIGSEGYVSLREARLLRF